ncbi:MAG: threonine dehydratase [Acidimicrobiales bacterium]|nr:threonine dehydratase [Acidimicrobiales bacterium]
MRTDVQLVSLAEIEAARAGLRSVLHPTPVERSSTLSALCDRPVLLKTEHRQRTGSFKIRGAHHLISNLGPEVTHVVAASAGNHAQGVALAATLAGKRSTIFMPAFAPLPKVQATRHYGAETVLGHEVVDDCLADAQAYAASVGAEYVPPFDDARIIAGQGTLGLELAEEAPEAEIVLVPVGGGGLLAGVAVALKALRPDVRIIGVEAAGAAAMAASLARGTPQVLEAVRTIADGIAVKSPSPLTLAHAAAFVDEMVTVTDAEIARALVLLLERSKMVVEPAGVVGLAALLAGKVPGAGPAVAILSGGNVDPLVLSRLIEHGLTATGRYLRLRIVVPDRPGALARVTSEVARLGLNVLSVQHQREGSVVGVDEVEVLLTLETRDPEHRLEVVDTLRAAGFQVELVD